MHKLLVATKKVWDAEAKADYINKVTGVIAWDKPKLLGDDDIDPTPRRAAAIAAGADLPPLAEHAESVCQGSVGGPGGRMIQGMFKLSRARHMMHKLLARNLQKVWDAEAKAFYYINKVTGVIAWDVLKLLVDDDIDLTPRSRGGAAGVDLPRRAKTPRVFARICRRTRRPHDPGHVPLQPSPPRCTSCWRAT